MKMAKKDFLKLNPYKLMKCVEETVAGPEVDVVIGKLKAELNNQVKVAKT